MCTGRLSNQGPLGPKSDALTTAPLRHLKRSTLYACLYIYEALPEVLGNGGTRVFISGEQGNNVQILRGTKTILGNTGNIKKLIFNFWGTGEQANLFQGNKETGTLPLVRPHICKVIAAENFRKHILISLGLIYPVHSPTAPT